METMTRYLKVLITSVGAMVAMLMLAGSAVAGPPDYGVKNPTDNQFGPCANESRLVKCLPDQIPFTESGIHIVNLPMAGPVGAGQITFWCQDQVGFKYFISVEGLAANSTYTVTAVDQNDEEYVLGVIHTNANGEGQLNGILRLEIGLYHLAITVSDADGVPVIFGGGGFEVL